MRRFVLAMLLMLVPAAPCRADHRDDDQGLFAEASADLYSDYFFRGIQYSDRPSFQPGVQLSYENRDFGGVGGGVWGQVPVSDSTDDHFNELDYDVHYNTHAGPLVLSFGELWYTAGEDHSPRFAFTRESYFTILMDAYLTPYFGFYHDGARFNDWYFEFGLSQPLPRRWKGRSVTLLPSLLWGFAGSGDGRYDSGGLVFTTVGLELSTSVFSMCRVGPALNYTYAADDAAASALWGGLQLSCDRRVIAPPPRH